jgi:hypothetical protein
MTNVVFTQELPRNDVAIGLVLATGVTQRPLQADRTRQAGKRVPAPRRERRHLPEHQRAGRLEQPVESRAHGSHQRLGSRSGAICPLSALDEARIAELSAELAHWLSLCGEGPKATSGVLLPGRTVTLTV